jgi:REP element-mobilizing transposase RayT
MRFNPELHHRRSIRLQDFDYASAGAYFVTTCTFKREQLFGNILNNVMVLSEMGDIVQRVWNELWQHYPDIKCDEFIIMPNHVHFIIWIRDVGAGFKPAPTTKIRHAKNGRYPTNGQHPLSEYIRALKTFSTRQINEMRSCAGVPVWQRNYYERIIRGERELSRIQKYIAENPRNWAEDPDRLAS